MTDTTTVPDDFGLIVTGVRTQELLDNETFQSTVNELSTQITTAIMSTAFPEVQKRQDLYMLHKALESLIAILKASASVGPIIQAQRPDEDDLEETLLNENED